MSGFLCSCYLQLLSPFLDLSGLSQHAPPPKAQPPPTLRLAGGHSEHPHAQDACAGGAVGAKPCSQDCRSGILQQPACVRQRRWGRVERVRMIIRGHFEVEPGFPRPVKISEAQKGILPPVPGLS